MITLQTRTIKRKTPFFSLPVPVAFFYAIDRRSRRFNSWAFSIKNASSTSPRQALQLYCRMHRQSRSNFDSFSINFAVKSCAQLSCNIDVLPHLHAHILKAGFATHVYVATTLLSVYASKLFPDACVLFDEMPERNTVTWNVMINGYSRQKDIAGAWNVFDAMPQRNVDSWSAMISACVDNSLWDQGLELVRLMMRSPDAEGLYPKPDQITLGPILAGCGRAGAGGLLLGKSVHAFSIKNVWELNPVFGTCLLDMYATCGLLRIACKVINTMRSTNVVTWTALIGGAAKHGYGREALKIFEKMRQYGVIPNELTFTEVLTACVQAGLVDEGREYFRMLEQYGLKPVIQHYGCMVDLFGKTGMLGEAFGVINTMPFQPNVVIWGSFLSSCKSHQQFHMVDKVIDMVMKEVRPENDGGVYSLLCDLYVLSGRWSEAGRLREMMQTQCVRKVRGSSFI